MSAGHARGSLLPRRWAVVGVPAGIMLALAALVVGTASLAAARAEESASRVLRPLSVEQLEELAFGRIAGDPSLPGEVVIEAETGRKSVRGAVVDLGGYHGRAEFEIRGEPNAQFIITLPPEHAMTSKDGGTTARVIDFTSSPSKTGALGPDGRATVFVGATLRLRPGQPGGGYRGPLDLFADYP